MPSDIRVREIVFAPPILCNCPTVVKVVLINVGNAAPIPTSPDGKFEVCLRSEAFRTETDNVYRQRVLGGEVQGLLPGQTLTVTFNSVVFLRPGRQEVDACADCRGVHPPFGPPQFEIGNDAHLVPCLRAKVDVVPAAWLQVTSLEIELEDSLGNRTRNVARLCEGGRYVATATIRNLGCVAAQNFAAELVVLDQNGNTLDAITQVVPAVAPHVPVAVEFRGLVPAPPAPNSAFSFRACADVTQLVQPQCNRALLCFTTAPILVVAQGGPGPTVSLVVNSAAASPLFPGQELPIAWTVQNSCADLGSVTARVTLKATGDLVYDSAVARGPIPVPPQSTGGEPSARITRPADPAVAARLYRVGTRTLRLEVTGTGTDPGPYSAEAPLVISAENPDAGWWSWDLASPSALWKDAYAVGATLTNRSRGRAALALTAADFREFDDDAVPATPTGAAFAVPPPLASLPATAASGLTWSNIVRDWDWIDSTTAALIGPTQRTFGYELRVQLDDEFGNALVAQSRYALRVVVNPEKLAKQVTAAALTAAAVYLIMLAFEALAVPFIGEILFAVLAALAAGAYVLAYVLVFAAKDPPVPDFRYLEPVSLEPPPLPPPLLDVPADLAPLRSLAELLARFTTAFEALGRIHSKLLGARIDGHAQALQDQADAYRRAERLLSMSAAHFSAAAAETVSALKERQAIPDQETVRRTWLAWRSDGLPASFADRWSQAGLAPDIPARLTSVVRSPLGPSDAPALEDSLQRTAAGLERVAQLEAARREEVLANL